MLRNFEPFAPLGGWLSAWSHAAMASRLPWAATATASSSRYDVLDAAASRGSIARSSATSTRWSMAASRTR